MANALLLLFPPGQIEGWGDEASYFVVSDQSRVRVEALLLFHESQTSEKFAAGAAAAAPTDGTSDRAFMSGSSVKGGRKVDQKAGKDESNSDGGHEAGIARRFRSCIDKAEEVGAGCCVYFVISAIGGFALFFAVGFTMLGLAEVTGWRLG